jgi:hypothetical protein
MAPFRSEYADASAADHPPNRVKNWPLGGPPFHKIHAGRPIARARDNDGMTDEPSRVVKVRIQAGGREVELESAATGTEIESLAATALALWKATAGAEPNDGRNLFGLVAAERATERAPSSTMDWPVDVPQ